VHAGFVAGYAESIQTVFLVAVPIAALAFLATWLIPQVELKQWPDVGSALPDADLPAVGAVVTQEAAVTQQAITQQAITQEALNPQEAGRTDP
jgi:hypothetical protein